MTLIGCCCDVANERRIIGLERDSLRFVYGFAQCSVWFFLASAIDFNFAGLKFRRASQSGDAFVMLLVRKF